MGWAVGRVTCLLTEPVAPWNPGTLYSPILAKATLYPTV
jgi:hypothetical protein